MKTYRPYTNQNATSKAVITYDEQMFTFKQEGGLWYTYMYGVQFDWTRTSKTDALLWLKNLGFDIRVKIIPLNGEPAYMLHY